MRNEGTTSAWRTAYAVLAGAAIGLIAARLPPLARLELRLADERVARLTPPAAPDRRLLVVAFDDATLDGLARRSPLDRQALASVLNVADAGHPTAIGLDVFLDQPAPGDDVLARQMKAVRAPLVLAATTGRPGSHEAAMLRTGRFVVPHLVADPADGVVRRLGEPMGTSFAEALVYAAGRPPQHTPATDLARTASGQPPFPVLPARAVLTGQVSPAVFQGRIVLIGVTATGVDRHLTPLAVLGGHHALGTPGVLLHGWQARSLLGPAAGPRPSLVLDCGLALLAALGGVLAGRRRWLWAPVLALAVLLIGMALYANGRWLVDITAAQLALLAGLAAGSAQALAASRRLAAGVRRIFARYLAPDVVDLLIREPQLATAGAEAREVTVLFTDLTGFTAMVDRMEPAQAQALLNAYLDQLTRIITEQGGVVDKIVGDAIHALFGAPVPLADAAARGLAAALAIDGAAEALRHSPAGHGLGPTRIGLHHGNALVGSFGGSSRLDYTAHGSVMNIGARLEQACKAIGVRLLVSEQALTAAGATGWLPVGMLGLSGLAEPVNAFTPAPPDLAPDDLQGALMLLPAEPQRALVRLRALGCQHPVVQLHIRRLEQGLTSALIDLR